jgi:hypothetical protein
MTSRRRLLKAALCGAVQPAAAQDITRNRPAPRQLIQSLALGMQGTQMIYVAAKLRIADHLSSGPKSAADLAAATKTHEDSLYRVLRALAGMGVFTEEEGRRFRLNEAAELLRTGVPGSLRAFCEVRGEEWMWPTWGALLHSVRTGQTAFDHLYGKGVFEWRKEHQEAARLFDEFQSEITAESAKAVVQAYDFSGVRKVVDVGGGDGTLVAGLLRSRPALRAVLFDLDHVAAAARAKFDRALLARCEFVGGDFFKSVPSGGDLYMMKFILHDWDDARALAILANCRRAMAGRGRLLVIEEIICGPNQLCRGKAMDVQMLVNTGGRDRTEKEYRDLLRKGGFEAARVIQTTEQGIIEATPRAA